MTRGIFPVLLLLGAGLSAGCWQADVTVPSDISLGGGDFLSSPPPSHIPPADPNSAPDLRRENEQLRQRIAWLERQNAKSDKKYKDQAEELADIRADMAKVASDRDRYRREGR